MRDLEFAEAVGSEGSGGKGRAGCNLPEGRGVLGRRFGESGEIGPKQIQDVSARSLVSGVNKLWRVLRGVIVYLKTNKQQKKTHHKNNDRKAPICNLSNKSLYSVPFGTFMTLKEAP